VEERRKRRTILKIAKELSWRKFRDSFERFGRALKSGCCLEEMGLGRRLELRRDSGDFFTSRLAGVYFRCRCHVYHTPFHFVSISGRGLGRGGRDNLVGIKIPNSHAVIKV